MLTPLMAAAPNGFAVRGTANPRCCCELNGESPVVTTINHIYQRKSYLTFLDML